MIGNLLGEHVVVVKGEARAVARAFANARSLSSEDVLDELRLPLSARDLATLSERLNGVEFEIRKPNLEDLFLRLSEKKGPTS